MKFSGLKLNFDEDGEVKAEKGKKILPHRVELIEEAFEEKRYDDAAGMIGNYSLRNCFHRTNKEMLEREMIVADKLIKIFESEGVA